MVEQTYASLMKCFACEKPLIWNAFLQVMVDKIHREKGVAPDADDDGVGEEIVED